MHIFSPLHLKILTSVALFWFFIPFLGMKMKQSNARKIAYALAFITIFLELYLYVYREMTGLFDPHSNIPIHLCSFAEFAGAFALWKKNQRAFELAFFWSFAACIQALITPDVSSYALFDTEFNIFFISHGLIILNVIWLLKIDKMKIRSNSLKETFFITNLLLLPVGLIDWLTNSNYMYLRAKPPVENPFLIGDWPYYILGFEFLAFTFFSILFLIMKFFNKIEKI